MLFENARIKYLRTASIQIFPQAVSCRVSAARTSVLRGLIESGKVLL